MICVLIVPGSRSQVANNHRHRRTCRRTQIYLAQVNSAQPISTDAHMNAECVVFELAVDLLFTSFHDIYEFLEGFHTAKPHALYIHRLPPPRLELAIAFCLRRTVGQVMSLAKVLPVGASSWATQTQYAGSFSKISVKQCIRCLPAINMPPKSDFTKRPKSRRLDKRDSLRNTHEA